MPVDLTKLQRDEAAKIINDPANRAEVQALRQNIKKLMDKNWSYAPLINPEPGILDKPKPVVDGELPIGNKKMNEKRLKETAPEAQAIMGDLAKLSVKLNNKENGQGKRMQIGPFMHAQDVMYLLLDEDYKARLAKIPSDEDTQKMIKDLNKNPGTKFEFYGLAKASDIIKKETDALDFTLNDFKYLGVTVMSKLDIEPSKLMRKGDLPQEPLPPGERPRPPAILLSPELDAQPKKLPPNVLEAPVMPDKNYRPPPLPAQQMPTVPMKPLPKVDPSKIADNKTGLPPVIGIPVKNDGGRKGP